MVLGESAQSSGILPENRRRPRLINKVNLMLEKCVRFNNALNQAKHFIVCSLYYTNALLCNGFQVILSALLSSLSKRLRICCIECWVLKIQMWMKWYLSRKHTYIILTPLKPHFYTVKMGLTGVYIITLFFLFLLKNIDCWYSLEPPRRAEIWKYQRFYLKIFNILEVKFSIYLNRRVFVIETFYKIVADIDKS